MKREIEQYREYLAKRKRCESSTVKAFVKDITSFLDFISRAKSGYKSWNEVTPEDAGDLCTRLSSAGKKETTINHAITSLRLFYDYLVIRDEAQANPFREVKFHKIKWDAPIVLDDKQSALLVDAPMREYQILIETLDGPRPRQHGRLIYLRDQLILELLYYSGMKGCELLRLRDGDIDCEEMTVSISGKARSNKGRALQLPECVIVTFKDYVRNRNEMWLNLASKAKPVLLRNRWGRPISPRSVRRKIAHYAQKSGLHPEISSGTLRATFTLRALRSGADVGTIQFLLGFEDLSSAESYVARFKSLLAGT